MHLNVYVHVCTFCISEKNYSSMANLFYKGKKHVIYNALVSKYIHCISIAVLCYTYSY